MIVPVTPPAERVHFILGEDDQDGSHESHPVFSELEELVPVGDGSEFEWKETARFVTFFPILSVHVSVQLHPSLLFPSYFSSLSQDGSSLRKMLKKEVIDGPNLTLQRFRYIHFSS